MQPHFTKQWQRLQQHRYRSLQKSDRYRPQAKQVHADIIYAEEEPWKKKLQQVLNRIVLRFTHLPKHRQTGLHCLYILGQELKREAYHFRGILLKSEVAMLSHRLLKTLAYIVIQEKVEEHTENPAAGHVISKANGKRKLHLYVVDDSVAPMAFVQRWYVREDSPQEAFAVLHDVDEVVVHCLLEDSERIFIPHHKRAAG